MRIIFSITAVSILLIWMVFILYDEVDTTFRPAGKFGSMHGMNSLHDLNCHARNLSIKGGEEREGNPVPKNHIKTYWSVSFTKV